MHLRYALSTTAMAALFVSTACSGGGPSGSVGDAGSGKDGGTEKDSGKVDPVPCTYTVTGAPASTPSSGTCVDNVIELALVQPGKPAPFLIHGLTDGWVFLFGAPLSNPLKTGRFTSIKPDCVETSPSQCCSLGEFGTQVQEEQDEADWAQWGPGTGVEGCGGSGSATCTVDTCGSYVLNITSVEKVESESALDAWLAHGTLVAIMEAYSGPPLSPSITVNATF
jgi:hypothetical protein